NRCRGERSTARPWCCGSGRFVCLALAAPVDVVTYPLAGLPMRALEIRLDPQARHPGGLAELVDGHEVHVADRAQAPVARERVLAVDLAAHDHACRSRPCHATLHLDDLADVDGVAEVDGLSRGCHYHAAREAGAG